MSSNDSYIGILLEEIRDQNKAVLEAVGAMQQHVATIPALHENLSELKADVKTIKAAVTATNADVSGLDGRVARLEQAAT